MPPTDLVGRLRAAGCVFAEEEAELLLTEAATEGDLERMVTERESGRPLELVVGWAGFGGLRIVVEPGVFVPRRRTEFVADLAIRFVRAGDVVVDLCCGSGAVGAVIAAAVDVDLYAADLDPAAVRCARRNLPPERVFEGDLFDALPECLRGRIQVLAVNAPYVPTEAIGLMPPEARDHEPLSALDGGTDGLEFHRLVAAAASEWLRPGGVVLIETSRAQADATRRLLSEPGLVTVIERDPEREATVAVGRRPLASA